MSVEYLCLLLTKYSKSRPPGSREVGGVKSAEAEFEAEKGAVNEEEALKDVDTFLHGWNQLTSLGTEVVEGELQDMRPGDHKVKGE
ncbi:U3 small nucleolar RNA associated protein 14 [Echinococcus multilocularis]|uniref:U3 small nucleolar RNA associated protein 14 n=1 Tax=Echinococcus multilocularis TaxID=6211 RepID=A0A0S4MLQ0_ECHMU|nr:U3 small nucleolar RNA associated protein 14 [Echinococcus multilocularis]